MMQSKKRTLPGKSLFLAILMLIICLMLPVSAKRTEAAANGFRVINGSTYYYENGKKHTGWLTLKGDKYYFDSKGKMVTGWMKDEKGQKRYFYKTGKMAVGWVKNTAGKTRYFYKGSGIMATGWVSNKEGKKRYFYTSSGYMATGWVKKSDGTTRCFSSKTGYMYTGLSRISKYYFFFDEKSGIMFTKGFKTIGSSTYYFKSNGFAKTGWLTLNGLKYYFSESGLQYKNTTLTINGKNYKFDQNGVATEITYEVRGDNVMYPDPNNGRTYPLVLEYLEHPGIANGEVSDLELLAALCECEAGNQGLIGMEAVALCILNRCIDPAKEFPSTIRGVIYHGTTFPQYSVVRNGTLLKRLNGTWNNRTLALEAAKNAMQIMNDYIEKGKPRTLDGFPKKDFDYKYFMMESSFWKQNLDFDRVDYFLYVSPIADTHMFFVDWISPK